MPFAELSTGQMILLGLGIAALALAVLFWLRPVLLVRIPVWILCHSFYRVRVLGRENIPAKGPALLVCNHVSYVDWLFLVAAQPRFVHFVIFAGWTRTFGLRHLLRWAGVIPIDKSAGPRAIVQSLRLASEALGRGEVVCIFAEGRFTRTGFLLPFHRGFEQIARRSPAPIIPVCLEHLWGSIFSYWGEKLIWKWPQELPYPVTVVFGAPMPPTAEAAEVRQAVQKLSADSAVERSGRRRPVHRQFIRVACRHPFRPCFFDALVQKDGAISYGRALVGAALLAAGLRKRLSADRQMVGLWLPPGEPAALANIALAFLGKVSVNLNYASSASVVQSAVRQCNLRHVLTSRRFAARVPLEVGADVEPLFLEDLRAEVTRGQERRTYLAVLLLPRFLTEYRSQRRLGYRGD